MLKEKKHLNCLRGIKKKGIAMLLSVLISFSVIGVTTVPASSGLLANAAGSVIDPIIEGACNYVLGLYESVVTYLVTNIVNGSITPGFSQYIAIDNNWTDIADRSVQYSVTDADSRAAIKSDLILNRFFTFSQNFGAVLATLILLFSLLICVCGKAELIHDKPFGLLLKYMIAMFLIWQGWNIIFFVFEIIEKVWSEFVIAAGEGETIMASFIGAGTFYSGGFRIYGMEFPMDIASEVVKALVSCVLGIFLMVKLLKQLFRLYIECVERSFILSLLSLFCPIVFATVVSRSSINILQSYIRMIITSVILLCINFLFMDVFMTVLNAGGWTSGLLNYICSIAYVKFALKIDRHLASMGLNVAQAGSGLLDSVGGSFGHFGHTLNAIANGDRALTSLGKSFEKAGVNSNNATLYNAGMRMQSGVGGMFSSKSKPTTEQFAQAKAQTQMSVSSQAGQMHATGNTVEGFNATADNMNITRATQNKALNALGQEGLAGVSHIQNLNGTKGESHKTPSQVALKNADGKNVAVIDGTNVYTNGDWSGQDMLSQQSLEASGINASSINRIDKRTDSSHQKYDITMADSDDVYSFEAVSLTDNPESLNSKDGIRTKGDNGEDILLVNKGIKKNTVDNEKDNV